MQGTGGNTPVLQIGIWVKLQYLTLVLRRLKPASAKVATNFKVFLLEPNPEKPAYAAEIGERWDPNWDPLSNIFSMP